LLLLDTSNLSFKNAADFVSINDELSQLASRRKSEIDLERPYRPDLLAEHIDFKDVYAAEVGRPTGKMRRSEQLGA
jgi:hypothetical protein